MSIHFAGVLMMVLTQTAVPDVSDAEREILELEAGISKAVVQRDTGFVERVWHDDFVYTGVRGELKSKKELLADLQSGDLKFELMKFDDIKVRIHDSAAIVTGRATTKGRSAAGEISGRFRYTRVYVRRDGAWRLAAFQGTPIPQQ